MTCHLAHFLFLLIFCQTYLNASRSSDSSLANYVVHENHNEHLNKNHNKSYYWNQVLPRQFKQIEAIHLYQQIVSAQSTTQKDTHLS